jgi:hypothetical protein
VVLGLVVGRAVLLGGGVVGLTEEVVGLTEEVVFFLVGG